MKFIKLAEYFQKLEATSARLEMIQILTDLFNEVSTPEEGRIVAYLTIGEIHPPYIGLELGMSEKLILKSISLSSGYETPKIDKKLGEIGDIGLVAEEFINRKKQVTLFPQELTIKRVYNVLDKISKVSGEGSIDEKIKLLGSLFVDAKPIEARYIARIVDGVLRLGVADMTILEAIALKLGSREYKKILEEAYNMVPDIGFIAEKSLKEGLEGIKKVEIHLGIPLRPMMAERLKTPQEAWEKTAGMLAADFKYDGERMQIHKNDKKVDIFSRRLENITYQFPDVAETIKKYVKAERCILEGEAIAFNPETGEFRPFQELMRRKRKHGIEEMIAKIPITMRIFDILYLNGENLLKKPFPERRKLLEEIIDSNEYIKPSELIYPKNLKELEEFFLLAIEKGCEGLVIKNTGSESIYQAGARGWLWIKLKRDYQAELTDTLDLVVVGAFYGRGRKGGLLSSFLMAVYDHDKDSFKTICKVGTGFKDEDVAKMNDILKPLIIEKNPPRLIAKIEPDHWINPQLVLEIAAAEITLSPVHTCAFGKFQTDAGLALRFPRFTGRYRDDKSPEDATTEKEIIEMFMRQRKIFEETTP